MNRVSAVLSLGHSSWSTYRLFWMTGRCSNTLMNKVLQVWFQWDTSLLRHMWFLLKGLGIHSLMDI